MSLLTVLDEKSGGGVPSIADIRETLIDRDLKANATAICAKFGIDVPKLFTNRNPLAARNEARRSISKLKAALTEKTSAKEFEELNDAMAYLSLFCDINDRQVKLDEEAARIWGRRNGEAAGGTIRDTTGQRIGVMLTAEDLRDPRKIAAKLPASEQGGGITDEHEGDITLGGFLRGVAGMRTTESVRAALTEGTGSQGGYLVPSILLPGILNAMVPASSLLNAGASVVMLDQSAAKSFTIAATDTIPTAAWRSENGVVAESDPAFRGITITPQSLAFVIKLSRELLQDAPGLEQALLTCIAQAFAVELDRAGLLGTGTAPEILGLVNTPNINTVNFGGTNGGALAGYAPFVQARGAIRGQNGPEPTAAITSVRDDTTLTGLVDTLGQPLRKPDALQNWAFGATTAIPTNQTVGTSSDCSTAFVGDFRTTAFYMRESVNVQMLTELYAGTGQVGFLAHVRADFAASYPKALAVIEGLRPAA